MHSLQKTGSPAWGSRAMRPLPRIALASSVLRPITVSSERDEVEQQVPFELLVVLGTRLKLLKQPLCLCRQALYVFLHDIELRVYPSRFSSAPQDPLIPTEQGHSTNPLERLNKEVKRRADVVAIFSSEASIIRLIGAVLLEQNDEWLLQCRYMQIEGMAELTLSLIDADPAKLPSLAA